jgi:hypothetical protein
VTKIDTTAPEQLPHVITTGWLRARGYGSRMTLWRKIRDGTFPPPDGRLCRQFAWKRETFRKHLEKEGLA